MLIAIAANGYARVRPAGTAVRVTTEFAVDSVTVGEQFRVHYTVDYPDSLTFLPLDVFDQGNCRVASLVWTDTDDAGTRTQAGVLTAMTLDLNEARVPPAPFFFIAAAGDTLVAVADEVSVPVRAITSEGSEPRDLKPQWQAPPSYAWLYWVVGSVIAAALIIFLWQRVRRTVVVAPPAPELPADYVALREFERIETMGLVAERKYKRFYSELIDAVRHYLERRYGIQAMDETSWEIVDNLARMGVQLDGLETLFRDADLVKFAKSQPDENSCKRSLEHARDLVVRAASPLTVAGSRG